MSRADPGEVFIVDSKADNFHSIIFGPFSFLLHSQIVSSFITCWSHWRLFQAFSEDIYTTYYFPMNNLKRSKCQNYQEPNNKIHKLSERKKDPIWQSSLDTSDIKTPFRECFSFRPEKS